VRGKDSHGFSSGARRITVAAVQVYTRFRVGTPPPKRRGGKRALVFIFIALLAGVAWIGSMRGWWSRARNISSDPSPTNESRLNVSAPPSISVRTQTPPSQFHTSATNLDSKAAKSPSVLDAQIALDRFAISPGSLDGVPGSQTRAAIRAFQLREGLRQTGDLDSETRARLVLATPALTKYRVDAGDLARLLPLASTWLGKSQQDRLDYETMLELVAERSHAHPNILRRLNSTLDWNAVQPGAEILVPAAERDVPRTKAAVLQIRLGARTLEAFDSTNRLLAHFPCSIAQRAEKRPVGELRVTVIVPNPDYLFNPENFPESAEAQELGTKLRLKPGPNNPVGTAWIGLNLPGYGIHGTPRPEDVGRTESHGCFRLANWNAEYLLQLVAVGTPVLIEP
jgi:lipoprotein-anchoring transpeptidase ErfK/SrfK